jgi:alpha-L-fucosidase
MNINRRKFIRNIGLAGMATAALPLRAEAGTLLSPARATSIDVQPDPIQKAWMDLGFGMFIHFGINTYYDKEWSDGTLDPVAFNPTKLNTDQWCRVARDAGMKYIVVNCKHHDGFTLWRSRFADYGVMKSPYKGDIIAEVVNSAQKYGLKVGMYYSIWDEHDPDFTNNWWRFMDRMYAQVEELLTGYGPVVEFWMDGFWKKQKNGWEKKLENIDGEAGFQERNMERDLQFIQSWRNEGAYWWQMDYFYQFIKSMQPECLIMNNSTTAYPGVPLHPVDIRSGEKYTEVTYDHKVWNWLGEDRYLPLQIETTLSTQGNERFPTGNWFWHEWDNSVMSVEQIQTLLATARRMDANLLLNAPITNEGLLRKVDEETLMKL